MRVRFWLMCSLWIAVAGCRDTGRHTPTLPVAATEAKAETAVETAAETKADAPTARAVLAERRALVIDRLRAYRVARVYPTDGAGLPIGVFRDDHGVRCPMSELMFLSGRSDLVDAVVRLDNDLKLADVHGGPLFDWMLQSGLTQEEIIEIQGVIDWGGGFERQNGLQLQGTPQLARSVDLRDEARAIVDAKLMAAERMLRAGTASSLATAVDRLAERRRQIAAATRGDDAPAASSVAAR
jgi:hypothetical protein